MKFYEKMLFVCANMLCNSQCMKLIRLPKWENIPFQKQFWRGF